MEKVLDQLYIGCKADLRRNVPADVFIRLYQHEPGDPAIPSGKFSFDMPSPDGAGWTDREFEAVTKLIKQLIDEDRIVAVVCAAGKSRSATVVLAYLCTYTEMTLAQAWSHLKFSRPEVDPHIDMLSALMKFLKVHPYISTLIGS